MRGPFMKRMRPRRPFSKRRFQAARTANARARVGGRNGPVRRPRARPLVMFFSGGRAGFARKTGWNAAPEKYSLRTSAAAC